MKQDTITQKLITLFGEEQFYKLDQITEDCIAEWFYGIADGFNPNNTTPEEVKDYIRGLVELKLDKVLGMYFCDTFCDSSVEDYYFQKVAARSKEQQ